MRDVFYLLTRYPEGGSLSPGGTWDFRSTTIDMSPFELDEPRILVVIGEDLDEPEVRYLLP